MWFPAMLLAACTTQSQDPPAVEPTTPRLLSPRDGTKVRVGVFPLMVRMPSTLIGAPVHVDLDGQDITDPLGLSRARWSAHGKGGEYLATLDVHGLTPGLHTLTVTFTPEDAPAQVAQAQFEWEPYPCEQPISVHDEAGEPLTVRAVMFSENEPLLYRGPNPGRADPMGRDRRLNAAFIEGERTLFLPKKDITLYITRGIRQDIEVVELDFSAGCPATAQPLNITLPTAVPTPDHVTADLHVHTAESRDAYTPHRMRQSSLAAADLDVVVFSDHNHTWDPAPLLSAPLDSTLGWAGIEARIGGYNDNRGHFNVYPLDPTAPIPEGGTDLRMLFDRWRDHSHAHPTQGVDHALIQLNHPRGIQIRPNDNPSWRAHAVFSQGGFDRAVPVGEGRNAWMTRPAPETQTTALDFDVLEVLNRFSWVQYVEVRQDWFVLLNIGHRPTGVGNSDSHAMAVELLGLPVNLVSTAHGRDTASLVHAIDQGQLTVSSGPVVTLRMDEQHEPGSQLIGTSSMAHVHVRAAPWVPAFEVRLVVQGDIIARQSLPHPLPEEGVTVTWPVEVASDSWVIAEAGWPPDQPTAPTEAELGVYSRIAPGYVPVGFTNPIWIDADGDGQWQGMSAEDAAERSAPMATELHDKLKEASIVGD